MMNPSPDNEEQPSATTTFLPHHGQPTPPMGYGPSPQYPPYHHQPAAGVYPGPSAHIPIAYVVTEDQQKSYPSFLCYSIFTMLCCCLPLGIAALVYSIQTKQANLNRDYVEAQRSSRKAQTLNHIALGLGIVFIILYIILTVLFFTSVLTPHLSHHTFQGNFGQISG